jgi:hypothetical protein
MQNNVAFSHIGETNSIEASHYPVIGHGIGGKVIPAKMA